MRNRLFAVLAVVVAAALLTMTPVVAQAAKLITGKDIKDSSVTGKDIKDSSLSGSDVKDSTVTGNDVKASSLNGTDLADGSVAGADIADGGVAGADIADGGVAGADIADGSVKGADVDESTLGAVPTANALAPLASGQTQSGTFGMGSATGVASGYLGTAINYPRPLAAPIADANVIDTAVNPDPVNCPAPGQASPGYLCLYFDYHSGIDYVYGYSDDAPFNLLPQSVGLSLYAEVTGTSSVYADGVWTVTAP